VPHFDPDDSSSKLDISAPAKGILKSISEGIRTLVVLDEKLAQLGKESDSTRSEVHTLQEKVFYLIGKLEEFDKRIAERFSDLNVRLSEVDKRIDSKVELSVRNHLTDFDNRPPRHTSAHKS
jgi:predicted nuclease with TOPRIM domain